MRFSCILLFTFLLPVFAFPAVTQNELTPPPIKASSTELSLLLEASTGTDLALGDIERSWLVLAILQLIVANPLPATVFFIGLYSLGRSIYSIANDCIETKPAGVDCAFSTLDLVFDAFVATYHVASGISRRDDYPIDMPFVHAISTHPTFPNLTTHTHISPINGSLAIASAASGNNGTWARHATVLIDIGGVTTESHHLMYRLASEDDLGMKNDGSIHQYRVQPTDSYIAYQKLMGNMTKKGKREEDSTYGFVADYLWKNNDMNAWNAIRAANGGSGNYLGSQTAKWMEDNNSEATCAVPGYMYNLMATGMRACVDNGVLAYGWNNQPYNFNGNAGTWVNNDCGCNGPSTCLNC